MHKCNFCRKKIPSIKVSNYFNKFEEGKFFKCSSCKIYINNKITKKIYTSSKKNINSYLNKNILYFLKSLFLYLYFLKLKKFFPNKENIILDFGSDLVSIQILYRNQKIEYFHQTILLINLYIIKK